MGSRLLIAAVLLGIGGLAVGCSGSPDATDGPQPAQRPVPPASEFAVSSPAFGDGEPLPDDHATAAAGGRDLSIPLQWSDPPDGTQSFAVETVDLHPIARQWVHWLVVGIPAETLELTSGASGSSMPLGARELENGFGDVGWGGPQPPRGTGAHEYRTTVYALDTTEVDVPTGASLAEFRAAIEPHVLASASVSGTYQR